MDLEKFESVRHLIELGYQDPQEVAARKRAQEQQDAETLRRADSLLAAGQFAEATRILSALAESSPEWPAPHRLLAYANYNVGRFDLAQQHLDWLNFHGIETPQLVLLQAAVELAQRRFAAARDQATYARDIGGDSLTGADPIIGEVHFRRGLLEEAEKAYRRELARQPNSAAALAGMAAVSLRRGEDEQAADWALKALEQNGRLPAVHYRLGVALARLGRVTEAITALETAAKLRPGFAAPFRWLAKISRDQLGDHARADSYRERAREASRSRPRRTSSSTATPDASTPARSS